MLYFGFILSIIFFTLSVLLFIGYIVLFSLKKNAILERFINLIFLTHMVIIMCLSWSLILMNGGFDVRVQLDMDYSYVLFIAAPVIVVYEVLDTIQRKIIIRSQYWYKNLVRYLLPVLTGILFFACSLIFYFTCNYFIFLKNIM